MLKSALAGGLILLTVGSTSAAAGGYCDCDDYDYRGYYGYAPRPARVYFYEPRVAYYRFDYRGDPRWAYAAYYNPPPRYYGYISRGPAVLVHRYPPPYRAWRRW